MWNYGMLAATYSGRTHELWTVQRRVIHAGIDQVFTPTDASYWTFFTDFRPCKLIRFTSDFRVGNERDYFSNEFRTSKRPLTWLGPKFMWTSWRKVLTWCYSSGVYVWLGVCFVEIQCTLPSNKLLEYIPMDNVHSFLHLYMAIEYWLEERVHTRKPTFYPLSIITIQQMAYIF